MQPKVGRCIFRFYTQSMLCKQSLAVWKIGRGGAAVPKREGPDNMEPGSLAWRRMQAQKFTWQDGDVTIRELPKKEVKTRSGDQGRPEPGRG
jgi:hypothetical protein